MNWPAQPQSTMPWPQLITLRRGPYRRRSDFLRPAEPPRDPELNQRSLSPAGPA